LFFTSLLFYIRFPEKKKEEGAGLTRQRNAYKLFKKNIYAASKKLKDSNSDFYQFAQKILKDFIADRFNVPGNALTVNEMEAMLLAGEIPVEIVDNMKRIMLL